jgi:hypothetical protein
MRGYCMKRIMNGVVWSVLAISTSLYAGSIDIAYKPSMDCKQAVARYVKYTDVTYVQGTSRYSDENLSYKKELRYLFKEYGTFSSPLSLLARVRSAHEIMMKYETDLDTDVYKKYEQISSALLLICAQILCYDVRTQILTALTEIDSCMMYWRYQKHHQLSYFFSKSPTKWVMGPGQEKEILRNMAKLERKQRMLYSTLGSLTGHMYALNNIGSSYDDAYRWIEQLDTIVSSLPFGAQRSVHADFETLAAALEIKLKSVGSLKKELLLSVLAAHKPSHMVRHWMTYASLAAAAGYVAYFHAHNPQVLPKAGEMVQAESAKYFNLLLDPFKMIYQRAKIAFTPSNASTTEEVNVPISIDNQIEDIIEDLNIRVKALNASKGNLTVRECIVDDTKKTMNYIDGKWVGYSFDAKEMKSDLEFYRKSRDHATYVKIINTLNKIQDQCWELGLNKDLSLHKFCLWLWHEYGEHYEGIIEGPIIKLIQLIANKVRDNDLTLMFTALIPLIAISFGGVKGYQWMSKRNYSPIRLALSDVNSLLIESEGNLDDYGYGKLVYLVHKLRHRASLLKDSVSQEFLSDVNKLESKQYATATKCKIVENMFNRYAFLGRIVT